MDRSQVTHLIKNAYHSTDDFYTFADQINKYKPELVIDAGCGHNPWKNKVNNLIGFDFNPSKTGSDYTCTYQEFDKHVETGSADFVFCLGSILTDKDVSQELELVNKWLKPGGYLVMRVRADMNDDSIGAWDMEKINQVQEQYNYTLKKPVEFKKIMLSDLDDETFAWLSKKVTTEWEFKVARKEKHRRDAIKKEQQNRTSDLNQEVIFKSWYVWWWEKPND